ncbi:beta-propeller fold lactonase family protein [Brevibacillus thermoruber]|uniref:beta-propeller fold lactonase family protein n=1 Tax=Brevibacillus thermoruber TaxID=33942 RepID=UPI000AB302A5|nr:beta-propeller fold lactonase family protein [Brevibacillus thermoruber]
MENKQKKRFTWIGWGLIAALALSACSPTDEAVGGPAGEPRKAPAESRPIAITRDGTAVVTANIDVPTITLVDVKKRAVTAEIPVGREPRSVALSPDDRRAYVAAMHDDRVDVVDLEKRQVIASVPVAHQPFAVVTSPDGKRVYVSSYRGGVISVIDTSTNRVVRELPVEREPRGLALNADGSELYVSHYLNGHVSVIDTAAWKVKKTVALAETPEPPNHDQKVSQGVPGMVENMTFSPDGKELWLPHILTNTDTPIQFESTVFPTVSVIDTTARKERVEERKHLFKQMNIVNVKNETEIVSNPADVAFLPDGSKAFVVMGGSEDLMTFDLRRGGRATQLLRRVPGANPRGMVISPDGSELYIHNAMSHDLVFVETGGSDSYKKAAVSGKPLPLIAKDPLPPDVRAGKVMFFSANSDRFAAPITGKNWMSCASCHFDGEINGLTFLTPKGPRNLPSNVLATKTGLMTWDGSRDDFADYLLTVQNEMGGMTQFDPTKPLPPEVQKMFDQMFAYLDYADSLPVPKSPYRKPDGSLTPLAQQGEALFKGKAGCITCHALPNYTDSAQAVDAAGRLSVQNRRFLHDVGTATPADKGAVEGDGRAHFQNPRKPGEFDTPTLRGVWATAPYLHDGSAATIEEVLTTRNPQHKHGNAHLLTEQERKALVEYVLSLE